MGSDVELLSFSFSSPSLLFGVLPPSFSCFSFFPLLLFSCFPLSPLFSLFPFFPRDAIEVCLPSIDLQSKKKTSRVTKKRIELPQTSHIEQCEKFVDSRGGAVAHSSR